MTELDFSDFKTVGWDYKCTGCDQWRPRGTTARQYKDSNRMVSRACSDQCVTTIVSRYQKEVKREGQRNLRRR